MTVMVNRCFVHARPGSSEPLFVLGEDGHAHLDGYAIVPIEDYIKLLEPAKAAEFQSLLSP